MVWLDLAILLVLGLGLARGYTTGVVRQVFSVVGLVLAFVLSIQLMEPVGAAASASLGLSPSLAPVLGFILVFLAIQVGVFALIRAVEAILGAMKLSVLNRAAGALLGAFKAAVVLSVVFLVLAYVQFPDAGLRSESTLYAPVADVLPAAWDFVTSRVPEVESLPERFGAGGG